MPNKPIEFKFTSDTEKYERGVKKAADETEKLERKIRHDLPDASDDAQRKIDRDFDKIGDSAKDAGKEAGQEFAQNLGESLSSGDTKSMLQDTLGGLVGSLGGGGPVGIAAAAGAGLALAIWNAFNKKSEEMRQGVLDKFDLFDEITGEIDRTAQLQEAFESLGGSLTGGITDARKAADLLHISMDDIAAVITGEVNPATEETKKQIEHGLAGTNEQRAAAEKLLKTIQDQRGELVGAKAAQEDWKTVTNETKDAYAPLSQEIRNAKAELEKLPKTVDVGVKFYAQGTGPTTAANAVGSISGSYAAGYTVPYGSNQRKD